MHFRKDINGLRAIAVVAVLLFHLEPAWLPGGFAGVDVFFVISGYLMTGIIFSGLQQQQFSLLKFYIARANRIIPALAVLCLVLLAWGYFYLTPWEYRSLGKHAASSAGFVSNLIYWLESGYFDAASKQKWLLHTWSLSVEWQFYLLYPLLLLILARLMPLRWLKWLIVISTAAAFAYSVFAARHSPSAAYFLLPARAWEMLMGGIAFLFPWQLAVKYKVWLERLGFSAILCSYALYSEHSPWPGMLALLPVGGVFLIIQAQREQSLLSQNSLLQQLGSSSYSLYLWHWPVVVFGAYYNLPYWPLFGLLLSLLLGALSYRYIETLSFPKVSRLRDLPKVVPLYLALLAIGSASLMFYQQGANLWLSRQSPVTQTTYQLLSAHNFEKTDWGAAVRAKQDLAPCRFNTDQLSAAVKQRLQQCYQRHGQGVLVLGDSHAIDLYGMLASRFSADFLVGITSVGCRPHKPDPACQYEAVYQYLKQQPVFAHVIFEQGGFYLLRDNQDLPGSRQMFAALAVTEPISGISIDTTAVQQVMQYLQQLSQYANVSWFGSRIEPHFSQRQLLQHGCANAFSLRPGQAEPFLALDSYISRQLPDTGRVRFISQNALLQFDFHTDLMNCQALYWDDGDHFSADGELYFGQRLPDDFLQFN